MKTGKGCIDCKKFLYECPYYMVHDELWSLANGGKSRLCLECLSNRIGRRLSRDDFSNVPANQAIFQVIDFID